MLTKIIVLIFSLYKLNETKTNQMKKEVIIVSLNEFADWEGAFIAPL